MTDKLVEPADTKSFIDSLVEKYEPESETFTVTLPGGEEFVFKACASSVEWNEMKREAMKFVTWAQSQKPPEEWKAMLPADVDTLGTVFAIACLSVSPKLTQYDALRLATHCVVVFETLKNGIDLAQSRYNQIRMRELVEESKKNYGGILAGETN